MPLLDHFRPPIYPARPWESFYVCWLASIGWWLNRVLPRRYVAEIHPRSGRRVQAEVAEFERPVEPAEETAAGMPDVQSWEPPVASLTMPTLYADDFEVRVIDHDDDLRLVAVVALVAPGNKSRLAARRGFAAKCAAYLQRGIGVILVDIATNGQGNLHNELVRLFDLAEPFLLPEETSLGAVAYRPARRQESDQIDVWAVPLAVGGALPVLPLGLLDARAVPVDLEATYNESRRSSPL
jgi:hypothetical protein